jgi:hypothetical protein
MYQILGATSNVVVATFNDKNQALHWLACNNTLPEHISRDADGWPTVETEKPAELFKLVKVTDHD